MKISSAVHAIRVVGVLVASIALLNCGTGSSSKTTLQKINVTPSNPALAKGTTVQLGATGIYSDGTQQTLTDSVTWQTAKSSIATISDAGLVTAMSEGASQVSATSQGVTGTTYVTIGAPALVGITVTPSPSSIPVGESVQLTATGKFSDGSSQDLTGSATWSSSGADVASVSVSGSVLGNAIGSATITATSGSQNGAASVNVGQAALVGLSVTPSSSSLPLGESEQLTATGKYSDGSTQDLTSSATWTTSGAGIASVSAAGAVQANGGGSATITAAVGSLNASASISVGQAVLVSIAVSPNQSSLPIGESEQLMATGIYSDGSSQSLGQSVAWSSSGPSIASVSASGSVQANALGTAAISATVGSISGAAGLNVTPAVVISLNVVPATVSIVLGNSSQLLAQATWSDGTSQDVTAAATWSSTPASIVNLAASGLATGLQVGSTTVFATYSGASGTASVTVVPLLLVSYYSLIDAQATGLDGTLYITNTGVTAGTSTAGNLCAMIYVFDDSQELNECCGCPVSDSGLRTLSLTYDLTANTLTGKSPAAGEIMIISSDISANPSCDASSLAPSGELVAWETNVQGGDPSTAAITETTYDSVPLSSANQAYLQSLCGFLENLGSGQGVCSCGTGDGGQARSSSRKRR